MRKELLPWESSVEVPFAQKDLFKLSPGVRYSGEKGEWYQPRDLAGPFPENLIEWAIGFDGREKLLDYQAHGVELALADGIGFLGQYDLGLGKTWLGFGIASALLAQRVLVVAPASVIRHWAKGKNPHTGKPIIEEWGYEPCLWASGKKPPEFPEEKHLEIVSYDSIPRLFAEGRASEFDLIILDESHEIRNGAKGKLEDAPEVVRNVFRLRELNPEAFRLCLTGTPIANRPQDLWNQLEWLWPGRFGTFWQFVKRYHVVDKGEFGLVIGPIREENVAEFRERLKWVSQEMKGSEIADKLPQIARPKVVRDLRTEEYLPTLAAPPDRVVIFCFNRSRVDQLGEKFPEAIGFHGEQSAARRYDLIEQANAEGRIVIATMDSAGTGIDNLARRQIQIFDQMPWTWGLLKQAAGRGHRLSSDLSFATQRHFMVSNPHEERKVRVFLKKLKEIESVLPSGMGLEEYLEKKYGAKEFDLELAGLEFDSEWLDLSSED
jgi:superfamily II DNA or RNA helicase